MRAAHREGRHVSTCFQLPACLNAHATASLLTAMAPGGPRVGAPSLGAGHASSLQHAAVCDLLPTPQAEAAFVRAVQKVLWTARGGPGHAALVRAMATWFVSKQRFSEVPFSLPLVLTAGRDLLCRTTRRWRRWWRTSCTSGPRPPPPRRPACPRSARPCVVARDQAPLLLQDVCGDLLETSLLYPSPILRPTQPLIALMQGRLGGIPRPGAARLDGIARKASHPPSSSLPPFPPAPHSPSSPSPRPGLPPPPPPPFPCKAYKVLHSSSPSFSLSLSLS